MKNILIFKTDKLGDLLNITPIISNIKKNYPNCNIDLICSEYNYPLAKYFKQYLNIYKFENSIFFFISKFYKNILKNRYDMILQLDGKKHSYILGSIFRSNIKSCISFEKTKNIFGFKFLVYRPNFFFKMFYDNIENSVENYYVKENKKYHYLSLYLKLLEKSNFKIFTKKHFFSNFDINNISKYNLPYYLLHVDQRWMSFDKDIEIQIVSKIKELSINNKLIITSDNEDNFFFNNLNFEFRNNSNIDLIKSPNLKNLIHLIYHSHTCISSHTGLIVHLAACFNKKIIDLVPLNIFNELDRWVPIETNYRRFDIKNLSSYDFVFKS